MIPTSTSAQTLAHRMGIALHMLGLLYYYSKVHLCENGSPLDMLEIVTPKPGASVV